MLLYETGIKFCIVHCNVWYENPVRLCALDSPILSLFSTYFKAPMAVCNNEMIFALSSDSFPDCLLKRGSHSHAHVY